MNGAPLPLVTFLPPPPALLIQFLMRCGVVPENPPAIFLLLLFDTRLTIYCLFSADFSLAGWLAEQQRTR